MNLVNFHNSTIVRTVGTGDSFQTTVESAKTNDVVLAKPSASEIDAIVKHNETFADVTAGKVGFFETQIIGEHQDD